MSEGMSHMFFESAPQEPTYFERDVSLEKMKIKPTLTVVVPENLIVEKEEFGHKLLAVLNDATTSVDILKSEGVDYTGKRIYPNPIEISMDEIKGTEHSSGWNGIVEGIGSSVSDRGTPYTFDQTYEYAKRIIEIARDGNRQDELNREIADINLVYYPKSVHDRTFLVDADGRSRTMVLKALEKLGCYVSISGLKVDLFE